MYLSHSIHDTDMSCHVSFYLLVCLCLVYQCMSGLSGQLEQELVTVGNQLYQTGFFYSIVIYSNNYSIFCVTRRSYQHFSNNIYISLRLPLSSSSGLKTGSGAPSSKQIHQPTEAMLFIPIHHVQTPEFPNQPASCIICCRFSVRFCYVISTSK